MTFGQHPSSKLINLYFEKPYQGQDPEKAKYIFLGKDGNWNPDIEKEDYFLKIEEYLKDGVAFWKKYKIHHPFLLPEYKGDGKRFHTQFRKTYDNDEIADEVSFVELIMLPTYGASRDSSEIKLFNELLFSEENLEHLKYLDKIFRNPSKLIFIAWGLTNQIEIIQKEKGLFLNIPTNKQGMDINLLNRKGNFFFLRHFSDAISDKTMMEIKNVIK